MTVADVRTHFDAVYDFLADLFDAGPLAAPVGDNEQPTVLPNVALYAIPGGFVGGTLGEPDIDVEMPLQVNCLSRRRDQAQWLQHRVRDAMLSQTLQIPDRGLIRINLEVPTGIMRDDRLGEREGQVFYSSDTFHVWTSPE